MIEYVIFWAVVLALLLVVVAPFWFVKKILKHRFTVLTTWGVVVVTGVLLVLVLQGAYWLLGYGWATDFAFDILFWIGIPSLVIGSAAGPFIVMKKVLKWPFTGINVLLGLVVAGGLLWLVLWGLYWAFAILQGAAFCGIYTKLSSTECFMAALKDVLSGWE